MIRDIAKTFVRPLLPALERVGLYDPPGYGLNGLDKKLLSYITDRKGFFVEAGANNGLRQSNTAYLEFYRGWRGVLVEPIPELANECRKNRPHATVEQCALVERDSQLTNVEMTYCNLMSIVKGSFGSQEADDAHIGRGIKFLAPDDQPRSYSVPTVTLDELFKKNSVGRVDLLSLDVEGYEAQALSGINFDRLAPFWILVESNKLDPIEKILYPRYELITQLSHHDRLYRLRA